MTRQELGQTLCNYEKILDRVREVVDEIGFLTAEYDTLEIEQTGFSEDLVHVVAHDSHYDLYDATSGSFPISFLFEAEDCHKDWYKKKREERERQLELERQQAQKEKELKQLQRLKEKYE